MEPGEIPYFLGGRSAEEVKPSREGQWSRGGCLCQVLWADSLPLQGVAAPFLLSVCVAVPRQNVSPQISSCFVRKGGVTPGFLSRLQGRLPHNRFKSTPTLPCSPAWSAAACLQPAFRLVVYLCTWRVYSCSNQPRKKEMGATRLLGTSLGRHSPALIFLPTHVPNQDSLSPSELHPPTLSHSAPPGMA